MSGFQSGLPGHLSAVALPDRWFIACTAEQLPAGRTASFTLQGMPLVLFRTAKGEVGAFVDRCPHRNAPLSLGRVRGEELECGYHGWRFDRAGACTAVPGLVDGSGEARARRALAHAVREKQGWIWVYSSAEGRPATEPFTFPHLDERRYATVRRSFLVESTLHAAAENALDVPHTAFLHGGLFRTEKKTVEIEAVIRRGAESVEAEYIGEPRPPGLAARILSPRGGTVTHFDRFILPSIVQVEYRLGEGSHLLITSALTPVTPLRTLLHAAVTFRTPLPGALLKILLLPVAMRIFRQDAAILAAQTRTIEAFGGEQFASTDIDVLGREIWRLLRQASGASEELPAREQRIRLKV